MRNDYVKHYTSNYFVEYNQNKKLYRYCTYKEQLLNPELEKSCVGYFKSVDEVKEFLDLQDKTKWSVVK